LQALVDVVAPVFLVIGLGYGAVWYGAFSDAAIDALMKFTLNLAIPCLLFLAIATLDLGASFDLRLLSSYYAGALAIFVSGILGARFLFKRPWEDAVVIGFCCLFSNALLLGLSITERAYGPAEIAGVVAIVALHAPVCYLLGITTMEVVRNRGRGVGGIPVRVLTAMFHNPLMIGIGLGFVANLSGLDLPLVLGDALQTVARAALPVALFGLGGVLFRYRPEGDLRVIGFICAMALLGLPALVWAAGGSAGLDQAQLRAAVLTASMAPGINGFLFASMYGCAMRVAASSVLLGTALSILTVWAWLQALP
jgi:malonate transporter and related proteins